MSRSQWLRIGALVLLLATCFVVAEATDLRHRVTFQSIREHVIAAGPGGVLIFVGAFLAGELLHLPGMLFFATGVVIWGRLWGGLLGGSTAVLSVAVTFLLVRLVGGQPLAKPTRPFMVRVLSRLETHPVATVAVLRMIFFLTPTVTYALALSPIRFGQMMLGSMLGLLPPLTVVALLSERVMNWLAR